MDITFFTVVPNNSLGKSAVRMLRSNDVHCTPVILFIRAETTTYRLGTYYLETDYGIRPSKVTCAGDTAPSPNTTFPRWI